MPRRKPVTGPTIADPPESGSRQYDVPLEPTQAFGRFLALTGDVDNLLGRHSKAGGKSGRPSTDEAPLSRAAILIMYAAWEVYIEESLIEAAARISRLHLSLLPESTKEWLKKFVSGDPWQLAGEGWRSFLNERVMIQVRGTDGSHGINDASPELIIRLQTSILGHSPFADVRWNNQSPEDVQKRLQDFINLRGEIAHTGRTKEKIWHGQVRKMTKFVVKAAREADYRLTLWLSELQPTTVYMWNTVRGVLLDFGWHSGKELRDALGVPEGDGRQYRAVNAYLARCAEEGLLERRRAHRGWDFALSPPDFPGPSEDDYID